MTPLRERMLEELCRHNYAPRTRETYVAQIAKLARHFGTSPDQLTREQVQEYQDLLTSQTRQLAAAGRRCDAVLLSQGPSAGLEDCPLSHAKNPAFGRRAHTAGSLATAGGRRARQGKNALHHHVWLWPAGLRGDRTGGDRHR